MSHTIVSVPCRMMIPSKAAWNSLTVRSIAFQSDTSVYLWEPSDTPRYARDRFTPGLSRKSVHSYRYISLFCPLSLCRNRQSNVPPMISSSESFCEDVSASFAWYEGWCCITEEREPLTCRSDARRGFTTYRCRSLDRIDARNCAACIQAQDPSRAGHVGREAWPGRRCLHPFEV